MSNYSTAEYEAPSVERIGSLAELTLHKHKKHKKHKYFATSTDYIYPNGYHFNFS